jgi:uncharacterized heparinase superfamily protein
MTGVSTMARLRRAIAFVRHVPPRRILARFHLAMKRQIAMRLPPALDAETACAAHRPQPLFPPRTGAIERLATGWRFTFLGRSRDYGEAIAWHEPAATARDQLWRMNLHYMEYLEELDYAAGADLIQQWIAANPPYRAGFWHDSWNSYTVSLRVVVWMQFLAAHDQAPAQIVRSIAQQIAFLERNLEHDLGGNHLIKNIKALLWASAFFAGEQSTRWHRLGVRLLGQELDHQILADGVHFERSPSYHAQVFADLLEIRHALGADPLGGRLDAALAHMAEAVMALAHPDGGAAQFNDSGLTMAYAPGACATAHEKLFGVRPKTPAGAFKLDCAGFYGVHGDSYSLIAKMGRIGADDLPAHAHGDIGSFELSVGGERMIVDQGVFEYVGGASRQMSRATASHNCVAIGGEDQAEFFGAFRCGRRPSVTISDASLDHDALVIEARHDGYDRHPWHATVSRRFEACSARIIVTDRITAERPAPASSGLLLHPECVVSIHGNDADLSRGAARLRISGSAPLSLVEASWFPDMGNMMQTSRLILTLPERCSEARLELTPSVDAVSGEV